MITENDLLNLDIILSFYYGIVMAMLPKDSSCKQVVSIKAKLGNILCNVGDHDGASEQYSKVIAQSSDIDKKIFSQMIRNSVIIKYQEGNYDESLSY